LATWKNVRPVEGEAELMPGVRTVLANGHSPSQVAHLLSSGGQQLLATADVSLLPALFVKNPDWQTILDQDGPTAVETRKRIFERAIQEKLMVTGVHWLQPNVGTISKDGSSYAFVPAGT
jgi:glyoxylase-like metal-dependent hydrolase (beta-lactamase superfamily II)